MKKEAIMIICIVFVLYTGVLGDDLVLWPGPDEGQDSFVAESVPDWNFGDWDEIDVYYNTVLGYLRFEGLDDLQGGTIESAYLEICQHNGGPAGVRFYRVLEPWDENTITWNNQPSHSITEYIYYYFPDESSTIQYWYLINVTSFVEKWFSGEWENFGWCLEQQYTIIQDFGASEMTIEAKRPCLYLYGFNPPYIVEPTSIGKLKAIYED